MIVRNGKVLTGIDILEERKFEPLHIPNVAKPRIGLLTNQTGVDSHGKRTIDVLTTCRVCSWLRSSALSTASKEPRTRPTSPIQKTA